MHMNMLELLPAKGCEGTMFECSMYSLLFEFFVYLFSISKFIPFALFINRNKKVAIVRKENVTNG